MDSVKIKCRAKINLNLKITGKRADGYHDIESIMQTINLYDILTISVIDSDIVEINLDGDSKEIPYDKTNLVYKAAELFLDTLDIKSKTVLIYIGKKIPVSAGLAGGSADAAGTLFGLNHLFGGPLSEGELHRLCAELGSDLNVCLKGGCVKAQGRGEIITPCEFRDMKISLIKPLELGISAKEAYTKFSKKDKQQGQRFKYVNDLEWAVIEDYPQLQYIKEKYPNAVMTGSGSTYFLVNDNFDENEQGYWVMNDIAATKNGVELFV